MNMFLDVDFELSSFAHKRGSKLLFCNIILTNESLQDVTTYSYSFSEWSIILCL